jgi:hypothetical protein
VAIGVGVEVGCSTALRLGDVGQTLVNFGPISTPTSEDFVIPQQFTPNRSAARNDFVISQQFTPNPSARGMI